MDFENLFSRVAALSRKPYCAYHWRLPSMAGEAKNEAYAR